MSEQSRRFDIAVVGGGLAGLAAAALAARAGQEVVVLEKGRSAGGRAATQAKGGYFFNQGPHALYRGSAGMRILRGLDIEIAGGVPNVDGSFAFNGGRLQTLPGGFASLLTTGLLSLGGKLELGRFFTRLPRVDAASFDRTSVETWLADTFRDAGVRSFVRAFARLTTYAADSHRMSAGVAIRQIRGALKGVLYLDGGWQTMVDALAEKGRARGSSLLAGARVVSIDVEARDHRVCLADGGEVRAAAVIVAASPETAAEIVAGGRHEGLRRCAESVRPVRVACLDLALRTTPRPAAKFALGIDRPFYFSLHSASARLAPPEGALIHAAKYLAGDAADDRSDASTELEAFVDLLQPGWRQCIVERRFLPSMIVANDLPAAERAGFAGRAGVAIPDLPGVFLAGDWVGAEALLADASFASAARAADLAVAHAARSRRAAAA